MIGREQIEALMVESIKSLFGPGDLDEWQLFVGTYGIDGNGAGEFCGLLAVAAIEELEREGIVLHGDRRRRVGAALTTVGIVCFEAALRAREAAKR